MDGVLTFVLIVGSAWGYVMLIVLAATGYFDKWW